MNRLLAAAILAVLPSFSTASPLGLFSQVIYFGDSLTDGGAAFALAGETAVPSSIYPNGQFTNGNAWAAQLGGTFANGTNFAVGGAEAVAEPGDISPDLGDQIATFLGSGVDLGTNALAMMLIGGNDIREADNVPEGVLIGTEVISAIVTGVSTLLSNGISKVAVFGMPDLGIFPAAVISGKSALASAFTPVFNTALQAALAASFTSEQFVYVDTFAIIDDILANAGALGITNTTDPCFTGPADVAACLAGDPNSFFFYDTLHPTEVVHTAFADAVRQQFATPVPLPAGGGFLLAGLAGLLVLSRRKSLACT